VRSRHLSLLATSSLAALLGCPLQNLAANSEAASNSDAVANGGSAGFANSERHDDPVDGKEDVSWASAGALGSGASALRVLMTDAPVEADSVFVTFCGIQVQALGAPARSGSGARDSADAPRGDQGRVPTRGEPGSAGAAGAPGAAGHAGEAGRPTGDFDGAGGASSGAEASAPAAEGERGDDEFPAAAGIDGESAEAERVEAERVEAERVEAERTEAERTEGDREGDGADVDDGKRSDGEDPSFIPPEGSSDRDSNGSWLPITDECQTLDLLTLRDGVTEAVGIATLPPGRYGQIRLMLVDASIVVGDVEQPLTLPSGSESGLKIGGGFALVEGAATTLTLDFDAGRSIRFAPGNGFMMSPVIELIDVTTHDGAESVSDGRSTRQPSDPSRGGAGGAAGRPGSAAPRGESAPRGDAPPPAEPRPEGPMPGEPSPDPQESHAEPPPPPDAPAPEAPASDEEADEPSAAGDTP
jgi:hypothetical protein